LNPRFLRASEIVADSGVFAGTIPVVFQIGVPPARVQTRVEKSSPPAYIARQARALPIVASILALERTMPGFSSSHLTSASPNRSATFGSKP